MLINWWGIGSQNLYVNPKEFDLVMKISKKYVYKSEKLSGLPTVNEMRRKLWR
jgi:L-arabinose isomerase